MKTIYTHIPRPQLDSLGTPDRISYLVKGACATPVYLLLSHFYRLPGTFLHYRLWIFYLKLLARRMLSLSSAIREMSLPFDSVRYFECDFLYKSLRSQKTAGRTLDVSSPRNLLIAIMSKYKNINIDIVNPDKKDLAITKNLFSKTPFQHRCNFYNFRIDEIPFDPETYNTISSISVIEHIREDNAAVRKLWSLLRHGGKLILSIPCSASAFIEFIDFDEYQLSRPDANGYVFGQKFYNDDLLSKRVFSVTGKPHKLAIYGEVSRGRSFENRQKKHTDLRYAFWREPYMMARGYRHFNFIHDLPGLGVIAMEFVKK